MPSWWAISVLAKALGRAAAVAEIGQLALELPCVVVVEAGRLEACGVGGNVGLAKKRDGLAGLAALYLRYGFLPIAHGNLAAADVVAPVAVDVGPVYPELHASGHGLAQFAVAVVQLIYVGIVVGMHKAASRPLVILRVLAHPPRVGCRVVGHPVEPYLHAEGVGGPDKGLQVVYGAVGRVYLLEIGGGIGAVDAPATGVNGH